MFQEGVGLLDSIAKKVIPDYRIFAFRVGGWVIQPFDNFVNAFRKSWHFSRFFCCFLGVQLETSYSNLDFTKFPYKAVYQFENTIEENDENGTFGKFR